MPIVAIGDIGVVDKMIHIGDEAMFEAFIDRVGSRGGTSVTAISSNPDDTQQRYGIGAIARIGFDAKRGGSRLASEERMRRVIRSADGEAGLLPLDDPALKVIDAVRESNGVIITGGGNLSSLWPAHVFERATIGGIARVLGKPLVVSGQTIGPFLDADDTVLVQDLLRSARMVGLRERGSFELCRGMGVDAAEQTVDDASYLVDDTATPAEPPYCLVTLAAHTADTDADAFVTMAAATLDLAASETGLAIVFAAHFASTVPGMSRGDSVMHDRVIDRMAAPHRVAATTDAVASARLARAASLVISSRYHPVVFAVANGVPAIGISVDDYTDVKLRGALGNFGQESVLRAIDLLAGGGPTLVSSVWASRDEVRRAGTRISEKARAESDDWWNRVAHALGG